MKGVLGLVLCLLLIVVHRGESCRGIGRRSFVYNDEVKADQTLSLGETVTVNIRIEEDDYAEDTPIRSVIAQFEFIDRMPEHMVIVPGTLTSTAGSIVKGLQGGKLVEVIIGKWPETADSVDISYKAEMESHFDQRVSCEYSLGRFDGTVKEYLTAEGANRSKPATGLILQSRSDSQHSVDEILSLESRKRDEEASPTHAAFAQGILASLTKKENVAVRAECADAVKGLQSVAVPARELLMPFRNNKDIANRAFTLLSSQRHSNRAECIPIKAATDWVDLAIWTASVLDQAQQCLNEGEEDKKSDSSMVESMVNLLRQPRSGKRVRDPAITLFRTASTLLGSSDSADKLFGAGVKVGNVLASLVH